MPNNLPIGVVAPSIDDQFRQNLRIALSDHIITVEEGAALEQLRKQLQISTSHAQQLLREVKAEHDSLNTRKTTTV